MPGQERRRGWPQWRGDYATDAPVGSDPRSGGVSPLSGAIAGPAYTRQPAETSWRPPENEFDDTQVPQLERLHALGRRLLELHDEVSLMRETMQAASDLMRAPCATAQLRAGAGLHVVATAGLPEEYLDPFRYIDREGITTCAAALRERRRVLVVNFDFAPGFAAFAREAAALHLRAAVSTPVLDGNGEVAAMFTLYFDRPFQPTARDLRMLDLCAQQVAPHLQRARIASELRESTSFNRAILENSPDCIKVLDLQGRVLSLNTPGRILLELDPAAPVEGRHWADLLAPECRATVDTAIAEAAAGRAHIFEMYSPTAKGTPKWWESSIGPIFGADGCVERLVVISRDISARHRAEQESETALARERDARRAAENLSRDSAWLAAIIRSTHDAIVSKDLDGIIQTWNNGAEQVFGYSAAEAIGQSITMLIPHDRLDEEPRILERLRRGETVDTFETVRRRKDGELIDVSLTIAPILDAQGRVIGASKIARDITERKRARHAEQEISRRFSALLDASSDVVYNVSADWREMRQLLGRDFIADNETANPDWMEGYIPADERPRVREEIQAAILDRRMFELEHRVLRADGTEGWTYSRAVPILDSRGEIVEWFGTATDITERKRREEQLALLAEIDEAIGRCDSEAGIMRVMSQRIGAHLDLDCCCLLGIEEQNDLVRVEQVWYAGEIPELPRRAALSDFVDSEFRDQMRRGETIVVRDAFADPRTDGAAYARYEVASFVTVPWQNGVLHGLLAFCDARPRDWSEPEIKLLREIADRVLPRIMRARVEERLRESEARYRGLVDQVVSGIAEMELDGRFRTVNDQYCRMVGYSREELLNMRMQDITHPDDLQRNAQLFERCVKEGRAFEIEKRYVRKDGSIIWVHNSASAVCDARGRPRSLAAVSIDISESKRAEAELLASLQRETAARKEAEILVETSRLLSSELEFDELVQKMTDLATHLIGAEYGSFFYNVTDEKGESYMLYTLSGANRADFEQMPMPRNTPLFQPTFGGTGVVRCGDVREHPDFGREAPYHGLPEGHLPVVSYLAVPVVSRNGTVHGGLFFAHSEANRFDARAERLVSGIAAQAATALDSAQAYRDIAASEAHLRQILDAMPSAVYTTDAQGKLTYFNPAAVEFAGREPELGKDEWCVSWKLYHPDGTPMPHDQCPMAVAVKENRSITGVEAIAERPDGTRRCFMPFPTPLHDANGKLIGGINMLVDITERKQAEEQVAQAHARAESQRRLYEAILSNTLDLAYIFDLDHRFIYANETLLAMWGKTREEALGKNCLELGYPGWHAAMHDRELDQVIASKRPLRGEVPFTGTFGRRIYDYIFVPVLGPDGEVEAVAGTTRDVTQQKEIEHRQRFLLDLSDRLRLLDDASAIRHVASEALARELGMAAAGFVEIEPDGETLVAGGEYCDGRMPDISGRRFSMPGIDSGYAPLLLAGENIFIEDYEADLRLAGAESSRELGLSSGAGVAVYNLGARAAYMYLMHPQPRAWPEADRQLVREVAERAWAAVERVRAADAMRRSEAQLAEELADTQLLTTVGAELVQEPTAEALFHRIVETAAALMRADCAVVHILDPERGELNLRAQIGLTPEAGRALEWVSAEAKLPAAAAFRSNQRVVIGDVRQSEAVGDEGLALFESEGINAAQSTPLVARNGKLVGMLSTQWRQRHVPTERRLALLDLLARQAADLIENRRHEQKLVELNSFLERRVVERTADLEQSEQQVRRMASMLTMAEHQERRRISQVLHDDLQQQLHSIQMKLSAARSAIGQGKFDSAIRHLEVAESWSGEGVDTARRLTVDLAPPILKSEGLTEALEWLVSQMRKMHGLDVILAGERELQLRDDAKRVLIYQVVRELLFNVVKYANTSNARIELRRTDRHMEICVVDEGVGFDPQKLRREPKPGGGGFGLTSANERLALVGGSLEIESAPGFGTSVILRVPLDNIVQSNGNGAARAAEPSAEDLPPDDGYGPIGEEPDWNDPDRSRPSGNNSDWEGDQVA